MLKQCAKFHTYILERENVAEKRLEENVGKDEGWRHTLGFGFPEQEYFWKSSDETITHTRWHKEEGFRRFFWYRCACVVSLRRIQISRYVTILSRMWWEDKNWRIFCSARARIIISWLRCAWCLFFPDNKETSSLKWRKVVDTGIDFGRVRFSWR